MVTTITSKGQILIPAAIRSRHNIKKGTRFSFREKGDQIILQPMTDEYIAKFEGSFPHKGGLLKELMKEKKRNIKKEAKKCN